MYPARTSSLWLATSASAGASRRVGMKSCDQRCMVMVSNRERIFDCKRWVAHHLASGGRRILSLNYILTIKLITNWYNKKLFLRSFRIIELRKNFRKIFEFKGLICKIFWNKDLRDMFAPFGISAASSRSTYSFNLGFKERRQTGLEAASRGRPGRRTLCGPDTQVNLNCRRQPISCL